MPLIKSASRDAISQNIRTERAAGKPERQSVAIALHTADEAGRQKRALGGPSWIEKGFAHEMVHPGGLLNSHVGGRTDHLPISVKAGSYVIPADVVSGLGQGNTSNGGAVISKMFNLSNGPYGAGNSGPFGAGALHRKTGGAVPIMAAGGEVVIPPEKLIEKFGPDLKKSHKLMDEWILHERKRHIKTLSKLPGPAKN